MPSAPVKLGTDRILLDKLQALPTLAERQAAGKSQLKNVFCWPRNSVLEGPAAEYCDLFAAKAGSYSWNARWGGRKTFCDALNRCTRTGAKLVVIDSPKVPRTVGNWERVREEHEARWRDIAELIAGADVEIAFCMIDLEAWAYRPRDGCEETDRHNRIVEDMNRLVYHTAKQALGRDVSVRRYGHLSVTPVRSTSCGGWGVGAFTRPGDLVDGGFDVSLYRPASEMHNLETLRRTIDLAKRFGVNEGSVWLSPGVSVPPPLCTDADLFPPVTGGLVAIPLDPDVTHVRAGLFGNGWYHAADCGGGQRNDRFPEAAKVHTVGLFPALSHPKAWATQRVHLVAFLRGCLALGRDNDLPELQRRTWEEGVGVRD